MEAFPLSFPEWFSALGSRDRAAFFFGSRVRQARFDFSFFSGLGGFFRGFGRYLPLRRVLWFFWFFGSFGFSVL
jgi:hypothetical protein